MTNTQQMTMFMTSIMSMTITNRITDDQRDVDRRINATTMTTIDRVLETGIDRTLVTVTAAARRVASMTRIATIVIMNHVMEIAMDDCRAIGKMRTPEVDVTVLVRTAAEMAAVTATTITCAIAVTVAEDASDVVTMRHLSAAIG